MNVASNQQFTPIDANKPNITPSAFNEAVETQLKDLQDASDKQKRDLDSHKKLLDWTFGFIVAVLIVCVVAVITFLLDAWRYQANEYSKFTEVLNQQQIQKMVLLDRIHDLELKVQKIEFEKQDKIHPKP